MRVFNFFKGDSTREPMLKKYKRAEYVKNVIDKDVED